jgi:iron complex outermembrane receptor protein
VQRWGNPSLTTLKFALDAAKPITDSIEAYAFGTYGNGHGWSDINWRNPSSNSNLYNTSAAYPGFNLNTVYPAGFTPARACATPICRPWAGCAAPARAISPGI